MSQHATHTINAGGAAPPRPGTHHGSGPAAAGASGATPGGAGRETPAKGVVASLRSAWRIYATGAVACAALSGVAYAVGIKSAQAEYAAHQADLAELKARQHKATALGRDLAAGHVALEKTLREVDALPLRLEPATAINSRLSLLDQLCSDTELRIDERRPGPAVDSPHYQTVTINLVGSGTYPACAAFLHELRGDFPDTAVRSFESSNPAPGRDQSTGTFRFELVWYTAPVAK